MVFTKLPAYTRQNQHSPAQIMGEYATSTTHKCRASPALQARKQLRPTTNPVRASTPDHNAISAYNRFTATLSHEPGLSSDETWKMVPPMQKWQSDDGSGLHTDWVTMEEDMKGSSFSTSNPRTTKNYEDSGQSDKSDID